MKYDGSAAMSNVKKRSYIVTLTPPTYETQEEINRVIQKMEAEQKEKNNELKELIRQSNSF